MKINKQRKDRKRKLLLIVIIGVLLIVAAGGTAAYLLYFKRSPESSDNASKIDLNPPTNEQVDAGKTAKKEFESRQTEASVERQNANNTPPVEQKQDVSVLLSSVSATNGTLSVRSIIQTIDKAGSCTLEVSKQGATTVSKTSGTQTMGSYSTCTGFDIPTSELSKGDWQLHLTYIGSAGQQGSATKNLTLP